MTFDEALSQVLTLLQQQGRISYRAVKRRFELDDDFLEDLKEELLLSYDREIMNTERRTQQAVEAEACFLNAIEVAQSQKAKSWELRAATSLARLW